MKITALITAGGKSKRMKGIDKLFYIYKDKPLLFYTLKRFDIDNNIDNIILVIQKDKFSELKKYKIKKLTKIVEGGVNRFLSIYNGISSINWEVDYIFIHDGARPYFRLTLINEMLENLKKGCIGVIPVLKVRDTIKLIENNYIKKTLKRDFLYYVQTPQAFNFKLLVKIYKEIKNNGFDLSKILDDSFVFEYFDYNICTIEGDVKNIKITYKQDLDFLPFILSKNTGF